MIKGKVIVLLPKVEYLLLIVSQMVALHGHASLCFRKLMCFRDH